VFNKAKIAICVAIVVGAASAGFAKDQDTRKAHAAAPKADQSYSLAQSPYRKPGSCWVPMPDENDEGYADSRGLGYWGSCSEKGAVPSR
jgi:hypothetical protein